MNLAHGPDGSIWIVDYYREIIEDYSAIPRHLQQQYGVYQGHDRGRIYRLTHRLLFCAEFLNGRTPKRRRLWLRYGRWTSLAN